MSAEDEVRQTSDRFYAALTSMLGGDTGPMDELWSHGDDVSTMHPLGGREIGWDAVRESWENAAKAFSGGSVHCDDLVVHVLGDAAYTTGTEQLDAMIGEQPMAGAVRATNIYRREGGAWKMVHHHADAHAVLQQILGLS
jgi:ketosteroid isomerase-like protein